MTLMGLLFTGVKFSTFNALAATGKKQLMKIQSNVGVPDEAVTC